MRVFYMRCENYKRVKKIKLSIIIPAYNEENTVGKILKEIEKINLKRVEKEFIVINDGSTDNTERVIKNFTKKFNNIKLINHKNNMGKGKAIRTGFKYATGDVILIQDADLEYSPKDIPKLLKEILEGENVVYGSRFKGKIKNMSFSHFIGNRILSLFAKVAFSSPLSDMETCYKMFRKEVIKNINLESNGFEIEAELTYKFLKKGYNIKEIPISYIGRSKKEKKISWIDGIKTFYLLFKFKIFDVKNFFVKNSIILFLYLFSAIFFIFQHSSGVAWDFSAYVLNAKYLFAGGYYFEFFRPPLTPFLLGVFSVFGWIAAEYLYIIFVSTLYLFSCIKFAKTFGIDKKIFYALALNPFVLLYGLAEGTELLGLSLLILFVTYLSDSGKKSGFFLFLAALTRYNNFLYLPLIFLRRNLRKIAVTLGIFSLTFLPWLLYNYFVTGSSLTSMADAYAFNIKYRDYIKMPMQAEQFLLAFNYLLPFFILGLLLNLKKIKEIDFIMVFVLILTIYSYFSTPIKLERYLFNLVLPSVYFSSILLTKWKNKIIFYILPILTVFIIFYGNFLGLQYTKLDSNNYGEALKDLDDCMVASNGWVYINYLGSISDVPPREEQFANKIGEGYRIVLYKNIGEPPYTFNMTFLQQFPIIKETSFYILFGNKSICKPVYKVNKTYIQNLNEFLFETYNYTEESNPCKIILGKFCLVPI